MEGGRLSTQNLKGLLDASYDPKQKQVGDFVLDKELSSGTSKVYRNEKTGQVVVAHRGTAGISDWGNNAVYALGGKTAYKLTSRYREAEKVQRRAEKKYGASNVSTIGHSQGGLQSELLGGRSKEIITLNKATMPFESNTNKNQYDVRSNRDVVSGLNPFAKKSKKDVNIKAKTYNPLTEHSGDILNRLDKNRTIGKGIYMKGFGRMRGEGVKRKLDFEPEPEPEPEQEPEPEDEDDGGDYVALVELIRDSLIDNYAMLTGSLREILGPLRQPNQEREEDILRRKITQYSRINRELLDILGRFPNNLEIANLIYDYVDEYGNPEAPFVEIAGWRGGVLSNY